MIEPLSSPFALALTYMLLHSTWQFALVAFGYQSLIRSGMIRTANGRYVSGLLALALIIGCALMTAMSVNPSLTARLFDAAVQPMDFSQSVGDPSRVPEAPMPSTNLAHNLPVSHHHERHPLLAEFALPTADSVKSVIHDGSPYVLTVWMLGIFLSAGRLVVGYTWLSVVKRSVVEIPNGLAIRSRELAKRIGLPAAEVFCSKRIGQAAAVGFYRPMVLIPASWLTSLPTDVLEAVIAHELAHLRRFDLWINLIQRVIEVTFFFHPAIWWLSNQVRLEREICCDELAIVATGKRCDYAIALETVGRLNVASPSTLAPSFTGVNQMNLLCRVNHVLHSVARPKRDSNWIAGLVAALLPLALIALSESSPSRNAAAQDRPVADSQARESDRPRSPEADSPRRRSAEADAETPRRDQAQTERRRDVGPESGRKSQELLRGFKPENDRESALLSVISQLRQEIAQQRREGAGRREVSEDSSRTRTDRPVRIMRDFDQFQLSDRWEKTRDGKVFMAYDKDHDQSVSLDEWLAMTNGKISEARRELQTKRFQDAEPSGDGKFTPREFIYWYSIGRHLSSGREGDRPRDGDLAREGDRPRDSDRAPEGDRARDGDLRQPESSGEGATPRRGPRDGDRAKPGLRDGEDAQKGPRDGERR